MGGLVDVVVHTMNAMFRWMVDGEITKLGKCECQKV